MNKLLNQASKFEPFIINTRHSSMTFSFLGKVFFFFFISNFSRESSEYKSEGWTCLEDDSTHEHSPELKVICRAGFWHYLCSSFASFINILNLIFFFIAKLHAPSGTWTHDLTLHLATKEAPFELKLIGILNLI
jgi:hypothetical protein